MRYQTGAERTVPATRSWAIRRVKKLGTQQALVLLVSVETQQALVLLVSVGTQRALLLLLWHYLLLFSEVGPPDDVRKLRRQKIW